MTRPFRIQYENAYYHVTCRGNAREKIFLADTDRERFLELLQRSGEIYQVDILAFVLMDNHFHLIVKTPRANLQEFMRHFNISYTSYFNRRHNRVGHLYQGRYKSFLIDADSYLLEVSRYVHLNPVRIKEYSGLRLTEKKKHLRRYKWSSYGDYRTHNNHFPFVSREEILSQFGGDGNRYQDFVESGIGEMDSPLERGKGHGIIGESLFIEEICGRVTVKPQREQPAVGKMMRRIEPEKICQAVADVYQVVWTELFKKGRTTIVRDIAIDMLYRHGGMNQREIGEMMGIDYSSVSVSRKRLRQKSGLDSALRRKIEKIQKQLIKI
ncbi:MAG: hypothetical protein FJ139_09025 [Deltaproteobacteria bacterium]|nr:hypothetical protein [Deltaproteobacteria bacterium]